MISLSSIPDLISRSLRQYQSQFPAFIKLALIYYLIMLLESFIISSNLITFINRELLTQLTSWIGLFFTSWLTVAFIIQVAHGKPTLKDNIFSDSLDLSWGLFILLVITLFAIFGGFFLFIIPGILIFIYLGFSGYILVLDKKGIKESIYTSRLLVKGIEWPIFVRFLLVLAPYLLTGILVLTIPSYANHIISKFLSPLIIALFYPFSTIYSFLIYKEVITKNKIGDQKVSGKFKFLFGISTIIGGLIFTLVFLSTLFGTKL